MSSQLVILSMLFGAAAGAFLPRVAYRLTVPFGEPARPACARCDRPFPPGAAGWIHAGPACCASGIGPAVTLSLVGGLLAVLLGPVPQLPVHLLAAIPGVLLAAIDLGCLRLPDKLVGTLALGAGTPLALLAPGRIGPALAAGTLVGAGYLAIAMLPGRGLGLGDVKLGAALAFLLGFAGWPAVAVGLGTAHLLNGAVATWLLVRRRARPIPFGPALLAGALAGLTAV
ncbi:leader peptidase (prepilin peptidase)/N-methyltransferase [Actinoplanes campanulatus]|uniref:Leader peptidase (Prepilin peptidase)/N-methyltransferase n=1 Tax=Actinoplanes campanulatus TaxID=113559 RepID=A0A7W5FJ66_9ACTN|nr:prepilin peptidase [Actinoplanes campanulatus]MBB3100463.1 leader peptidase (prepilin peptidase)/N-methyltransferase [Actinoplanes campanulatus]